MKLIAILALTVMTISLLLWTRPDIQAELQPLPPARVFTGNVQSMDIQPVTRITGKLQPARKVSLRMEVSGRLVERHIEPGYRVESGDPLLKIDDRDLEDAVTDAEALLQQEQDAIRRDSDLLKLIQEEYEIQGREVARLEELGSKSLASKSNYDAALRSLLQLKEEETRLSFLVRSSRSRLANREVALDMAKRNLDRSVLTAPFTATVNTVYMDIGDYISAGQVAVDLVQTSVMDLYIEIPGDLARQLELDQEINVVSGEKTYTGRIFALAVDPNPVTHTHALRIRLPGEGLFPGQLAEAAIPGRQLNNVEVVPVSAVLRDDGSTYVFAIQGDRLVRKPISILARHEDMQVISGVPAGTSIVTRDVGVLADGQTVQVK